MYEETEMRAEKSAEPSVRQVPQAMTDLEQAVERLDHQAGRLCEKCGPALQPEMTAPGNPTQLDSVRPSFAPLALDLGSMTERVNRIADQLAETSTRIQL